MNTSNNNLLELIKEKFGAIKEWITKNLRIVVPAFVVVLAIIVFIIAMSANKAKLAAENANTEAQSQLAQDTVVIAVPEISLEEDAYPELNDLINRYYTAMAAGDIDTIKSLNNNVDDTETIRIQETSKYVESYESIKVYSKVGPSAGTYLAYVSSMLKFTDYEEPVPGMKAFYVCTDENGTLYINDGEESDSVTNYIREASLQDDVKELNNTIAVAYNDMLAENEDLTVFLVDLTETIDTAVGEALAQSEGSEDLTQEASAEEATEETAETPTEKVITVKATTTVNVRSSDSETADKLGKATEGEEFKLIEKRGNGWSEIEYNGKSAYIKSEFLEDATKEIVVNDSAKEETTEADDTSANTTTTTTTTKADTGSTTVSGTVMVKENVRVRASASEDGEKIATVYMGEKLDLIEKMSNGWTKIKYKGQIAYVKSEYVE